jgi:hypothetical protein
MAGPKSGFFSSKERASLSFQKKGSQKSKVVGFRVYISRNNQN